MKIIVLLSIFLANTVNASEKTCSRTAKINYQDVLVDSSSSIKGDGLKFYLNKDPIAKEYLRIYQENAKPSIKFAAISTLGLGISLAGLLTDKTTNGILSRNSLIGIGIGVVLINLFVSKTYSYKNEKNLYKAVDEYNKRNRPKIYLTPIVNGVNDDIGVNLGIVDSF